MKNLLFIILFIPTFLMAKDTLEKSNMFAVDLDENTLGSLFQKDKTTLRSGSVASEDFTMGLGFTYARRKHRFVSIQISLDATRTESKFQSSKTTTWTYALGLGPLFNFTFGSEMDIASSWYAGGLVGLEIEGTKTSRSSRELNHMWWLVSFGKRFPLENLLGLKNAVYSPSLAYKNISYDDNSVLKSYREFNFNVLKLDFFFN